MMSGQFALCAFEGACDALPFGLTFVLVVLAFCCRLIAAKFDRIFKSASSNECEKMRSFKQIILQIGTYNERKYRRIPCVDETK